MHILKWNLKRSFINLKYRSNLFRVRSDSFWQNFAPLTWNFWYFSVSVQCYRGHYLNQYLFRVWSDNSCQNYAPWTWKYSTNILFLVVISANVADIDVKFNIRYIMKIFISGTFRQFFCLSYFQFLLLSLNRSHTLICKIVYWYIM